MLGSFNKIAALIAIIVIALVGIYVDHNGYARAERKYLATIEATEKANAAAIAKAEEDLQADVAEAKTENERLENALQALEAKADAAPDADECGLSADSVRDLDALR